MSDYICLSILMLICILGIIFGSDGIVMGVKEKNDIYRKDTANGTIELTHSYECGLFF